MDVPTKPSMVCAMRRNPPPEAVSRHWRERFTRGSNASIRARPAAVGSKPFRMTPGRTRQRVIDPSDTGSTMSYATREMSAGSTADRLAATAILIVGAPRSGTTWLAKILDSHPDVLYRHEPDEVVPCGALHPGETWRSGCGNAIRAPPGSGRSSPKSWQTGAGPPAARRAGPTPERPPAASALPRVADPRPR